ncbi:MAG TPA: DUF983 domain-containing protein [Ktedonobacterales bacterium]
MLGWSLQLIWRALILRCPKCGKGKLYRRGFTMFERCAVCGWRFEREEGYWTGAMAVNLVITELLVAGGVVPLAISGVPAAPLLIVGVPVTIALPFLLYRHSKSLWMAIDFLLNPTKEMFQD